MITATAQPELLVRDLARLLEDLAALHAELAEQAREKLEAMRKADSERIAAATGRETALAARVAEREGLRRQMTRRLAGLMGMDAPRAERLTISELAALLPESWAARLIDACAVLRRSVVELQRLQQTTALVTKEMLGHLNAVVAVMRGGLPGESYTRGGRKAAQATASVFEAVG